jgi:hypothetical protein
LTRLRFAVAAAIGLSVAISAGAATAAGSPRPHIPSLSSHRPLMSPAASQSLVRHHRARRRQYRVQAGDSWWSIAHHFGVDWNRLAGDNDMTLSDTLHPGMVLVLPRRGEKPVASAPATPTPSPSATTTAAASTPASSPAPGESQSSFEQCVIAHESGGNPDATNGAGYWGLFQFSAATWAAYGGNPADFGYASAAEQERVFANAMAQGGESNWAPYDGC